MKANLTSETRPDMKTFVTLWIGQLVSMIGSGLTGFGIGVWVYQHTGSATQFAMNSLFMVLTSLVLSQFSGALVDRWDRRKTLLWADVGAAANTLIIAALLYLGRLEVWHVYAVTVSGAVFNSFRWPALNGIIVQITPTEHLSRANGLVLAGEAASNVLAPMLAGTAVVLVGLPGVLVIDAATFLVFLAIVSVIRVPPYRRPEAARSQAKKNLLQDIAEGWVFVYRRTGLAVLLVFNAVCNFLLGIVEVLFTPLMLSLGSIALLGTSSSIVAGGMLLGSLVMSTWKGPKRRIRFVYAMIALQGLLVILVGLRPAVPLVLAGAFGYAFLFPLLGASQVIWQTRVPQYMQGRIAAVRGAVSSSSLPLAIVVAGPLADKVFNPLLTSGGALDGTWTASVLGVGPDRGLGLLFIVMGALSIAGVVLAYMHPRVRHLEDELHIESDRPAAVAAPAESLASS